MFCLSADLKYFRMDSNVNIPEIDFRNSRKKNYEFEIISNRVFFKNKKDNEPPFRPHRISHFGILFTMKGEGYHFIDFKRYPYEKGTVIFLSKEQVHAFERNEDREAYLLTFTEAFLEKSSFGPNLMRLLTLFNFHLYHPVLQLEEKQFEILLQLVMRMKREYENPDDDFSQEIIQSALKVFLFLSERLLRKKQATSPKHLYHEEFVQFQFLVKEHILENNQVQFYADALGISTKKLNRITQAIVNQPAKDYLVEMLVLEIKRLLVNSSLSVKEIAYKTGFDVPTNFVKFFKKSTGLTPMKFRKQY
jgi:AraC-like DNA-binding protein